MKFLIGHFFWIINILYTGSISMITRFFLLFYVFFIVLTVISLCMIYSIFTSLLDFITSLKRSIKQRP
jgi:hypothetical protein